MWGRKDSKISKSPLCVAKKLGVGILFFGLVVFEVNSVNVTPTDIGVVNRDKKSVTTDMSVVAAALTSSNNNSINGNGGKPCNATSLDDCWSKLPPLAEPGIPSSPQAVDTACSCVDDWAKQCLGNKSRAQVKASVRGAHETFTFLCRDHKFRAEFLSHAVCYKKISRLWDDCARRFIESLKRVGDHQEPIAICCIRLRFLQCVTEVAHLHCSQDAAKFLQRMAETLVRSTMRSHVPAAECVTVSHHNCSQSSSSSCSSLNPSNSFEMLFPLLNVFKVPSSWISSFFPNIQPFSVLFKFKDLLSQYFWSFNFKKLISPLLENFFVK